MNPSVLNRSPEQLEKDIELQRRASKRAIAAFKDRRMDVVDCSLAVNAYASAYYAGSRYHQTYGNQDVRTWWQRLAFRPRFDLGQIADAMAQTYLQRFPSLSPEMVALVTGAAQDGFRAGYDTAQEEQRVSKRSGTA